jgi:hypothetical protein
MKQLSANAELEVVVLQRASGRFEWHLCNSDGIAVAKGRATSVSKARMDALATKLDHSRQQG